MSPTESELRASLRRGEHDARPDPDALLATARGARRQRRVRVLGAGASAVVVAGVAVAAVMVSGGGGSAQRQAGDTSVPTAGSGAGSCAVNPPSYAGMSPPLGGGKGPLFTSLVNTVRVCGYDVAASAITRVTPTPVLLTGIPARMFAASLDNAPSSRPSEACPDIARATTRYLTIVALTADGTALPTVTVDLGAITCQEVIRRGTVMRYDWTPPAGLLPSSLIDDVYTLPTYSSLSSSPAGPASGTGSAPSPAGSAITESENGSATPSYVPPVTTPPSDPTGSGHRLSGSPLH